MEISFRPRFTQDLANQQALPYASTTSSKSDFRPRKNMNTLTPRSLLSKIRIKALLVSLFLWLIVINYNERSVVRRTLNKCLWENWDPNAAESHKVALFADPQIMDDYSYPGRPALVNAFIRRIIDNYHKRNWEYVKSVLDPDTTFFLGDLFDGGRGWDDKMWFEEYKRFHSIYNVKSDRKTVFSLPGNHDIGFGETVEVESLKRFKSYFGETSSVHDVGNHTFVLLDTISLSDYSNPNVTEPHRELLERLAIQDNGKPRIILTHVPFYRFPDQQKCGPLRESSKKFPIMKGVQYQTVIDHDLTQEILAKVHPEIIFAGDDHDYCHIEHDYLTNGKPKKAEEITVKSCSMNMGIEFPAIQLLTLNTNHLGKPGAKSFKTEICYLPAPYSTGRNYLLSLIANLSVFVWAFLFNHNFMRVIQKLWGLTGRRDYLPYATVPKDGNLEYEGRMNRDFVGLGVNCAVGAIGILTIFSVYYNAFY